MLQFGITITKVGDPLRKISIERLFQAISRPKPILRDQIDQLRIIKEVDEKQYRNLKKKLPYFVCGIFHPAIRRIEHFASIEYFMLDMDHLSDGQIEKDTLMEQLRQIPEVVMAFTSPSADGVKVMLRLAEPCSDAAQFSSFYKVYSYRFAKQHGWTQVIDFRTSDVSRACFFSYDAAAYFNADAQRVFMKEYLKDLDFDQAEQDIKVAEKFIAAQQGNRKKENPTTLDDNVLQQIKLKLNPNARIRKNKQYTESPQVEKAIPVLADALKKYNIELVETQKINYGKKLKLSADKLWAEVNIFYGKKGWSIVKTTKSGSHPELAELGVQAIAEILSSYSTQEDS